MRGRNYRWLLMSLLVVATAALADHYPRLYAISIGDCASVPCFWPAPLTIVAGDSVMFYITSGGIDDGPAIGPHNVVADDGSFRCALGCDGEGGDGTPRDVTSGWYFTRTFSTPGVVGYHDEASGARGEIVVMPALDSLEATAVEYYYAAWNFYFVTASLQEMAALEGGAFGGAWKRTGMYFAVWADATHDHIPTCRFFSMAFGAKSSHFYTPYAEECASLQAGTTWQYESIAFYVQLPDANGVCPKGSVPLYRLFNNGIGGAPNHRYTTSLVILDQMLAVGWSFEGNGTTKAFACVPEV